MTVEQAYAAALALSPDERLELAQMLLDAAESPPDGWWESMEPELDAIEAAIESGEMETHSWPDVQQRLAESGKRDSLL